MRREHAKRKNAQVVGYLGAALVLAGTLCWCHWRSCAGRTAQAGTAKPRPSRNLCAVTLRNGVAVELLGICSSPTAGRQWWTPDGAPLPEGPCEGWSSAYARQLADGARENPCYEVVVRLVHAGRERVTTEWQFAKGDQSLLGTGHGPAPDLRSVFIRDHAKAKSIDFQLAVAAGAWETDCVYPQSHWGVDFDTEELADHAVIWQRPREPEEKYPGKLKLNVIHDYRGDYEVRVLAVDRGGETHRPVQTKSNWANKLTIWRGYYDLDVNDIAEFRLQVRPLYWVHFKDVSFCPGHRTPPTAERK